MSLTFTEPPCNSNPDLWFSTKAHNVAQAKAICSTCPRKEPCLQQAMEFEDLSSSTRWGIFGGLTPEERIKLRARKPN